MTQQTSASKTAITAAWIGVVGVVCAACISLGLPLVEKLADNADLAITPTTSATSTAAATPMVYTIPTPFCRVLLLSENFDDPESAQEYLDEDTRISIEDGRLRFAIDEASTGVSVPLFGQYEAFTLDLLVFPVGEIYDGSVNILFLRHGGGWYEIQVRLRRHEVQILKYTKQDGETYQVEGVGWTSSPAVDLGTISTSIRLDVEAGKFMLWVNGQEAYIYQDENPYLRGEIYLGAGAGEVTPVTMEIDNVKICGH